MPYDPVSGKRVEVIVNSWTMTNRENPGQNIEESLTFTSGQIVQNIANTDYTLDDAFQIILDYLDTVAPNEANDLRDYINKTPPAVLEFYLGSIISDGYIRLSIEPISESVNLDTIRELYRKFPWVTQIPLMVPLKDSNGNIRFIKSRRNVVLGTKTMYCLKQYAEEKFSVTSLSSTNLRNENSRSKANKNHTARYSNTPIKFGYMETAEFSHIGLDVVVAAMMVHSTSPHARRQLKDAFTTENPYEVDIKPGSNARNRSAEILNAYLKALGLRIRFIKTLKCTVRAATVKPVSLVQNKVMAGYLVNPGQNLSVAVLEKLQKDRKEPVATVRPVSLVHRNKDE